jgi:hypothetical protein
MNHDGSYQGLVDRFGRRAPAPVMTLLCCAVILRSERRGETIGSRLGAAILLVWVVPGHDRVAVFGEGCGGVFA